MFNIKTAKKHYIEYCVFLIFPSKKNRTRVFSVQHAIFCWKTCLYPRSNMSLLFKSPYCFTHLWTHPKKCHRPNGREKGWGEWDIGIGFVFLEWELKSLLRIWSVRPRAIGCSQLRVTDPNFYMMTPLKNFMVVCTPPPHPPFIFF